MNLIGVEAPSQRTQTTEKLVPVHVALPDVPIPIKRSASVQHTMIIHHCGLPGPRCSRLRVSVCSIFRLGQGYSTCNFSVGQRFVKLYPKSQSLDMNHPASERQGISFHLIGLLLLMGDDLVEVRLHESCYHSSPSTLNENQHRRELS